jgi:hypothetical protein
MTPPSTKGTTLKRSLFAIGVITAGIAAGVIATGPATARPLILTSTAVTCHGAVSWQKAVSLEGSVATLVGRVASTKFASSSNGSPTFLDVGRAYPNPARLSIVIWIENRASFGRPEVKYRGRTICVRGLVSDYAGSPEIIARSPSQITIKS